MTEPKKMKRRIRKKLCLGEFAIIGFEFSCSIEDMDEDKVDGFFSDLLNFLEVEDLQFAGGGSKHDFGGYITLPNCNVKATDADREKVQKWLSAQAGVSDVNVEPLSDAIYGIDEA
jgi:uncharacterized protein YggL (DUF469 family)